MADDGNLSLDLENVDFDGDATMNEADDSDDDGSGDGGNAVDGETGTKAAGGVSTEAVTLSMKDARDAAARGLDESSGSDMGPKEDSELFQAPVAVRRRAFLDSVQGTPYYIAPEVLRRRTGIESDFFSLGVIAFRCLTGQLPFQGRNRAEVLEAIRTGDVRWELLPQSVSRSPELVDLLASLLEANPKERIGGVGGAREVAQHPFF